MSYLQLFVRFLVRLARMGGPVAQIAMLRRELVDEERWISSERFNKLLAVMQVLPDPSPRIVRSFWHPSQGAAGGVLAGLGSCCRGSC